jgi:hypothetical protein
MLRHQLAVYSPISFRALAAAAAAPLGWGSDPLDVLESLLRREYAADDVLLCGSGTQALQLAIHAARAEASGKFGQDAIVALPAFSCFDVASAAIGAGGPVALYDLDPLSLSPDLASVERVLEAGARIVVVAPLYGIPVDWEAIEGVASAHGARLIEDAAQGHGATYREEPLGALSEISTLSFGRGKGWTGGSGGAVLVRRLQGLVWPPLEQPPRFDLGTVLRLDAQFALGRPALYGLPRSLPGLDLGETVYHPPRRPTGLSRAAAGAVIATRSESLREADHRRGTGAWLRAQVQDNRALRGIAVGAAGSPGFLRFPVLAQRGFAGFADQTAALRCGIAPSYPRRLSDLPELAPLLVNSDSHFPGASRLVDQLITLPAHSLLSAADRVILSRLIREYGTG